MGVWVFDIALHIVTIPFFLVPRDDIGFIVSQGRSPAFSRAKGRETGNRAALALFYIANGCIRNGHAVWNFGRDCNSLRDYYNANESHLSSDFSKIFSKNFDKPLAFSKRTWYNRLIKVA